MENRYPNHPGSKVATPETSRQAADSVASSAERLRDQCLSRLRVRASTADELAEYLGESVLSIRPRVSELVKMSKVQDSGARRKNRSGKSAAVWEPAAEDSGAASLFGY